MFSRAQRPMSTFALPIDSEEISIRSVLEVAGRHAIRLTQREIERFVGGDNIFPHRSDLYLIFESQNKEEDVDGLDDVVSWKEASISIKPVGITEDGEVTLFSAPSPSKDQ